MRVNARRLCLTVWGGRALLYRASCPMRLIVHPIRRSDGDGKQDRGGIAKRKKTLTCPQFENGDGIRCSSGWFRQRRTDCTTTEGFATEPMRRSSIPMHQRTPTDHLPWFEHLPHFTILSVISSKIRMSIFGPSGDRRRLARKAFPTDRPLGSPLYPSK